MTNPRLKVAEMTAHFVSFEKVAEKEPPLRDNRLSDDELRIIKRDVAMRLETVFAGENRAEVARRLQTTDATVKPYFDGTRLPNSEMLLQIKRTTGCSLDWLMTGKGVPFRVSEVNFSEEETSRLVALAQKNGLTFQEQVKKLVTAGLAFTEAVG